MIMYILNYISLASEFVFTLQHLEDNELRVLATYLPCTDWCVLYCQAETVCFLLAAGHTYLYTTPFLLHMWPDLQIF